MNIMEIERLYCSQGDTSGKHIPKKFFYDQDGCFLYDKNNISYLDMQMFNSAANFGYKNSIYTDCIKACMDKLYCLANEFMSEEQVFLAEKICKYMSNKYNVNGRVHFTVGGAQAVDDALKLAFNYTSKRKILAFEGAYHGRTMASSSISSSYRYTKLFGSIIDTQRIPFPNCERCAYGKIQDNCNLYCLTQIERLFESEFNGLYDVSNGSSALAAFIFEPVLGKGGYVFPPDNYLRGLFKLLHKYNILTIADEVQMGFYRTGKLWSFENYGVVPDVIIFGKSITNGIWPLAGLWANEKLISPEKWPIGSTHCTFAGHPLAMSLGIATFNLTETDKFIETMKSSSEKLKTIIASIKNDCPFIGRTQVKGHAVGLDIIDPKTGKADSPHAIRLIETALNEPVCIDGVRQGLVLTLGGIHNSSLMLSPSVLITEENLELFNKLIRYYSQRIFPQ